MRLFYSILICIVCSLLSQQVAAQQELESPRNFQNLLPGLPESRVRELIGGPTRIESFRLVANQNQDTSTFWFYSINNWTLVFTNHYLDRIEISRDKLLVDIQQWADTQNKEGIRLIYGK